MSYQSWKVDFNTKCQKIMKNISPKCLSTNIVGNLPLWKYENSKPSSADYKWLRNISTEMAPYFSSNVAQSSKKTQCRIAMISM